MEHVSRRERRGRTCSTASLEPEGLMNAVDPLTALVVVYAVMASVMLVLWLMDRWTRNVAIADVGWCIGLVSAVAWYAWSTTGDLERKILLVLMAALYGLRLGLHILLN